MYRIVPTAATTMEIKGSKNVKQTIAESYFKTVGHFDLFIKHNSAEEGSRLANCKVKE